MSYAGKTLKQDIQRNMDAFVQLQKAKHPELGRLSVKLDIAVYPKRPKGFSRYPFQLVGMMLNDRSNCDKTNAQLIRGLDRDYPGYKASVSLMYAKLSSRVRVKVGEMLRHAKIDVALGSDVTLSKIKSIIKAGAAIEAKRSYRAHITVTDDTVVVGDRTYAIDKTRTHPSIRVGPGRNYLRCDQLELLLNG